MLGESVFQPPDQVFPHTLDILSLWHGSGRFEFDRHDRQSELYPGKVAEGAGIGPEEPLRQGAYLSGTFGRSVKIHYPVRRVSRDDRVWAEGLYLID